MLTVTSGTLLPWSCFARALSTSGKQREVMGDKAQQKALSCPHSGSTRNMVRKKGPHKNFIPPWPALPDRDTNHCISEIYLQAGAHPSIPGTQQCHCQGKSNSSGWSDCCLLSAALPALTLQQLCPLTNAISVCLLLGACRRVAPEDSPRDPCHGRTQRCGDQRKLHSLEHFLTPTLPPSPSWTQRGQSERGTFLSSAAPAAA